MRIEGMGERGVEKEVTEVSSRQMTFNPVGRNLWLKAQRDLGAHISASNQFYACSKSNSVSSLGLNLALSNVENAGIGKQFSEIREMFLEELRITPVFVCMETETTCWHNISQS